MHEGGDMSIPICSASVTVITCNSTHLIHTAAAAATRFTFFCDRMVLLGLYHPTCQRSNSDFAPWTNIYIKRRGGQEANFGAEQQNKAKFIG